MTEITLSIPDEALTTLQMAPKQFGEEPRLAAAMKLYEQGRSSSGAAARVAGLPLTVFLTRLADFRIDMFQLTEEEIRQEARFG